MDVCNFAVSIKLKTMKRITTILFITFLFNVSAIHADSEDLKLDNPQKTELLMPKQPKKRPQIPAKYRLNCYYSIGHLSFAMPRHIHYMQVSIGDEESPVFSCVVFAENPEINIPNLEGEYDITCQTDGNQIFTGKLNF